MTPSLSKTLAAVPKLNREGQPFAYTAEKGRIRGTWSTDEATYTLTVTLDEDSGTFAWTERVKPVTAGHQPELDTDQVRSPLFTFLVKHGWAHPEDLRPLGSRWVVR